MNHNGDTITSIEVNSLTDSSTKKIELIKCKECGFAHQYPLPTLDELGEYYAYHFYSKQKPDYLSKMDDEADYWLTMYDWRLKNIFKHTSSKNNKVLDVGSSGGFFLEAARRLGSDVYGIEPSLQAAEYCQRKFNIKVSTEVYEKSHFDNGMFDVIHLSLVLEHLLDPFHFIKWASEKLKKNGILVIEAPHEFNKLQNHLVNTLNYPHWYFSYPDHINYFSRDQLKNFVTKDHFNLLDQFATYPMEMFVLHGVDYLKEPTQGKTAHFQRMNFELGLLKNNGHDFYTELSRSWIDLEIGRTQIQFFKKN